MIFSLTDAQAAALAAIRGGKALVCDLRVWSGLVKRGLATGEITAPRLTPFGTIAASLAEMLAMPVATSGSARD